MIYESRPFVAQYPGVCGWCDHHFPAGTDCVFRVVEAYGPKPVICHQICPTYPEDLVLRREVCQTCFQEKTPAGTCGCS